MMAVNVKGGHCPPEVFLMGIRWICGLAANRLVIKYTLAGIELMQMIKKGQMVGLEGETLSAAEQFFSALAC